MIRKKEIEQAVDACNMFTEAITLLADKAEDETTRDGFCFAALVRVSEVLVDYINEDPEVIMQRVTREVLR